MFAINFCIGLHAFAWFTIRFLFYLKNENSSKVKWRLTSFFIECNFSWKTHVALSALFTKRNRIIYFRFGSVRNEHFISFRIFFLRRKYINRAEKQHDGKLKAIQVHIWTGQIKNEKKKKNAQSIQFRFAAKPSLWCLMHVANERKNFSFVLVGNLNRFLWLIDLVESSLTLECGGE